MHTFLDRAMCAVALSRPVLPFAFAGANRKGATMAGKFEIDKDKAGRFRFRLKGGNGEIVASGEAYETKASAKAGVQAVINAAAGATVVELDD
jgi:uncharacterized protein